MPEFQLPEDLTEEQAQEAIDALEGRQRHTTTTVRGGVTDVKVSGGQGGFGGQRAAGFGLPNPNAITVPDWLKTLLLKFLSEWLSQRKVAAKEAKKAPAKAAPKKGKPADEDETPVEGE